MSYLMRVPSLEPIGEQAWLASRLMRRQVVDVSSIEPVGRVADIIYDPQSCQLRALIVESITQPQGFAATIGRALSRRHDIAPIGLEHVIALDGDVVMVNADPFRLSTSRELEHMPRLKDTCDLAILTMRGVCLGSLADLLLDQRGATITGYVVSPTKQGELSLPTLPPLLYEPPTAITSEPDPYSGSSEPDTTTADQGVATADEIADNGAPSGKDATESSDFSTRMRVIPASSRVRISESLILLIADIEPLREEVVVITHQPEERVEVPGS